MNAGTVALITGANRGIGLETARQLLQKNITVVLGVRDTAKSEATVKTLSKNGGVVHAIGLDVTNPADHQAAHDFIAEKFGKLDILINNAGIERERHLRPDNVPVDTVREIFETNFFAVVGLTQALLPLLRKSEAGRIVNLSSRLGSLSANANAPAQGWFSELGYNSSKASINMFTILLARELNNMKVNAAHPGWVQTDMGGPDAPMQIEEGAKTSVWLATLPEDGPTGGFYHQKEILPW